MTHRIQSGSLISSCLALAVIVLPQANRAHQHEYAIMASRQIESPYIVVDAAEIYAEQNTGIYPAYTGQFLDWLPRGLLLVNPYTLAATEPVDGAAASPGQIGYVPVVQGGYNVGFTVTVWGWTEQILTIARYPGMESSSARRDGKVIEGSGSAD